MFYHRNATIGIKRISPAHIFADAAVRSSRRVIEGYDDPILRMESRGKKQIRKIPLTQIAIQGTLHCGGLPYHQTLKTEYQHPEVVAKFNQSNTYERVIILLMPMVQSLVEIDRSGGRFSANDCLQRLLFPRPSREFAGLSAI
jgi:hypothetical protein